MVLHQKPVCAVVCRLSGVKNGQRIGMKLNIAALSVATTNNAEFIYLATLVGAFRRMTLVLQLHPVNQLLSCKQS